MSYFHSEYCLEFYPNILLAEHQRIGCVYNLIGDEAKDYRTSRGLSATGISGARIVGRVLVGALRTSTSQ